MSDERAPQRVSVVAGVALLGIRGVLLWVVIPLAACVWVPGSLWLRRRGVRFGQFLGWVDLNLLACMERTVLRPLFPARVV